MADVLKIALDRRAELHEEAARMDEFIRMAESLLRRLPPRLDPVEAAREPQGAPREPEGAPREPGATAPRDVASGVARMNLMRRGPTTAAV